VIGEDYEVRTRGPAGIFHGFVGTIEGWPFTLAEDNVDLFSSLSEEFDFDDLLAACKAFRVSSGDSSCFVKKLLSRLCSVAKQCS
jgi:hypothetical protein